MRMVTSSKASLSVLLIGLLLTIVSYPFRASDASKLNHGPSEITLAEVTGSRLEGGSGIKTYQVEYRFALQRRVFRGECWLESPHEPEESLSVQYLVEDPRVNCLTEGYLVSWTWFLLACAVTLVGGVWFLVAFFFLGAPAEKPKKSVSSSRGRKKSKRRGKRK